MNLWSRVAGSPRERRNFRVPDHVREYYLHATRPSEKWLEDMCEAFDRIEGLKIWNRFLTFIVGIEGVLIGWLGTELLHCIEAGRKSAAFLLR